MGGLLDRAGAETGAPEALEEEDDDERQDRDQRPGQDVEAQLGDPNICAILLGANRVLSQADQQLVSLVIDSERDTERVARYLHGGFVDGVVIVSAREHDSLLEALQGTALPSALVGRPPGEVCMPWAGIDNRSAARAVTEHLVAAGRRRVGIIAVGLDRDSGSDRLAGFRDALGESFDPELVVERPLYEDAAGRDAMRELLERAPDLDGVFATSDAVAAGALEALHAARRSVPGDVALAPAYPARPPRPLGVRSPSADLHRRRSRWMSRHGDRGRYPRLAGGL